MAIIDVLGAIIDFFVNQFKSLIWLIQAIPQFITVISSSFAFAPSFLYPFLSVSLAIMIIFAVIKLIP